MAKSMAVVLSSGGLRSLVAAGLAGRDYRVAMLHVKDGRVSQTRAAAAFQKQVTHHKPVRQWTVDGAYLRQMALPAETAGPVTSTGSDPHSQLIPFRDLELLILAAGFARQLRAGTVVWGVQAEAKEADRIAKLVEVVQLANQLLEVSDVEVKVEVKTPLVGLDDGQMLELGHQMNVPFAASWTCQMDVDFPCMACPACARRTRAFRAAQLVDPLVRK